MQIIVVFKYIYVYYTKTIGILLFISIKNEAHVISQAFYLFVLSMYVIL